MLSSSARGRAGKGGVAGGLKAHLWLVPKNVHCMRGEKHGGLQRLCV